MENRDKEKNQMTTGKKKQKRKHVLWTHEEIACLEEAVNKKTHIREISKMLGKSEKAIRRKCEWLGVSSSTTYRPRKTKEAGNI